MNHSVAGGWLKGPSNCMTVLYDLSFVLVINKLLNETLIYFFYI